MTNIDLAAAKVRAAVGVPPTISWRNDTVPTVLIESYLYIPSAGISFPKLPIHMLGVLLEGKAVDNIQGDTDAKKQFSTPENRLVIVPKDTESHWAPTHGSVTMAAIYISGTAQDALASLVTEHGQLTLLNDKLFIALTRQLLASASNHKQNPPHYDQHLIQTMVAQLQWLAMFGQNQAEPRSNLSDPAIHKALGLIAEHIEQNISIEWLANTVQVSPSLFRKRFHNATGNSVHRYILSYRINRAKELIEESSLPLAAIADQCGFSSQSHMNTAFKREQGVSPGQLRRH